MKIRDIKRYRVVSLTTLSNHGISGAGQQGDQVRVFVCILIGLGLGWQSVWEDGSSAGYMSPQAENQLPSFHLYPFFLLPLPSCSAIPACAWVDGRFQTELYLFPGQFPALPGDPVCSYLQDNQHDYYMLTLLFAKLAVPALYPETLWLLGHLLWKSGSPPILVLHEAGTHE